MNSACRARESGARVLFVHKSLRRAPKRSEGAQERRDGRGPSAWPCRSPGGSPPRPHHGNPRSTGVHRGGLPRHPAAYFRRFLQPLPADIKRGTSPFRRGQNMDSRRKNSSATAQPPFPHPSADRRAIFSSDTTAHARKTSSTVLPMIHVPSPSPEPTHRAAPAVPPSQCSGTA